MTINCNAVNIKKGSSGETVTELQKYLKYNGYYNRECDGDCGSYTVEAIKKFQNANGLVVDGVFGPLSCKKSYINGKDISSSSRDLKLAQFLDMKKRFDEYVQKNGKEPNIAYLNRSYPYEYVTLKQFKDMVQRYETYTKTNGKEPLLVRINKTTTSNTTNNTTTSTNSNQTTFTDNTLCESSGGGCLGQTNGYRCGPHSILQSLRKFGIKNYSEATIAGYAGTTTAGTGHSGLETAIAKIARNEGITLKVKWYNFSDLGSTQKERFKKLGQLMTASNTSVFGHLLYRNKYGHYEKVKTIRLNNSNLTIPNSLGNKCRSPAYCGYMESRSFSTQVSYYGGISQKSICVITKA